MVFAKVVRRLVYKILSDVGNLVDNVEAWTLAFFERCAGDVLNSCKRTDRAGSATPLRPKVRCDATPVPRKQSLTDTVDEFQMGCKSNYTLSRAQEVFGFKSGAATIWCFFLSATYADTHPLRLNRVDGEIALFTIPSRFPLSRAISKVTVVLSIAEQSAHARKAPENPSDVNATCCRLSEVMYSIAPAPTCARTSPQDAT